jgi:hypothetical protein
VSGGEHYEYCPFCTRANGHMVMHEASPGACFRYRSPWEYLGGGRWRDARKSFGDSEHSDQPEGQEAS